MAELLTPLVSRIRIPSANDKVYKDECAFCFDTPESENGLYISMCTNPFFGVGKKYVEAFSSRVDCQVFLHLKRVKHEIVFDDNTETEKKQPTRMAIGLEGGFDVGEKKYSIEEKGTILVMPGWHEFELSQPELPEKVTLSANAILAADSAARRAELEAMEMTWDGEVRIVSKYAADLTQLDNGKKIPPTGWKCEKCDLRENLWLNLTDGVILCGRRYADGSGGNNHAVEHFEATRYPLAVKLGTITPDSADVHSYAEDDMVVDPLLADHLAHFGIDIMNLQKTEKTMVELELDMNQRAGEWSALQESGSQLRPLHGPGLTGIHNLGNTCYMNSVMQVVMTIPQFVTKYYEPADEIFASCTSDPSVDFNVQMAKFAHGLLSGDYSKAADGPDSAMALVTGIRPQMFKTLIGAGHREFSKKKQQDAHEFLLHLLTLIDRNSRGTSSPTSAMKFRLEDRIECMRSHKIKYSLRDDFCLELPIPLDAATNRDELAAYETAKAAAEAEGKPSRDIEVVRAKIPLSACLEAFSSPTVVDDFYSSAVNAKTTAKKTVRLATFPDFLFLHMQKFTVGDDWVEKKLDVSLDMPDVLDLSHLRGKGKQPGEDELTDAAEPTPSPAVNVDEAIVNELMAMGFSRNACVKGVHFSNNTGIETAMNWIMEHMSDADFDAPLQLRPTGGPSTFVADESAVAMIEAMGFNRQQAVAALKATDNNTERAVDWIFSHPDELSTDEPMEQSASSEPQYVDGNGQYRLMAFISHMGTSTKVGHYVCHIRRGDDWVIFNDEKVALSEHPPKDLAYMYLYRRQ